MRWWLGLAVVSVFVGACERDFSVRSRWTAGSGGAGGSELAGGSAGDGLGGGEAGGGGAAPPGGSAVRAGNGGRSSGGRGSGGKAAANPGGGGNDDAGGDGAGGDAAPAGGTGGSTGTGGAAGADAGGAQNLPPLAEFDHYHRYRGEDALENPGGTGDEDAPGAAGAPGTPLAYAVPPGPTSLLGNDTDPDGDELRVQSGEATSERGGSVVIAEDGSFVYTPPNVRFWGNDYFDYLVTDGENSTPGRARFTLSERKVQFEEVEGGDSNGWVMLGAEDYAAFGYVAASAGDVNGDGIEDLLVGAPGSWLPSEGTVYVVFGRKETGPLHMAELAAGSAAGYPIEGFRMAWEHGFPLGAAGDMNGDGLGDLVIASLASETAVAPSVFVVLGRRETTPLDLADITTSGGPLGVRIDPLVTTDRFGTSVSGVGDLNGDGYDEVAIGAPGSTRGANVEVGAVHVLLGRFEFGKRSVNLEDVIAGTGDEPGFTLRGIRADSRTGFSVGRAGDVNGDGLGDLVIGAPEQDPAVTFGYDAGSAYVVFGTPNPDTIDLGWLEEGREEGFFIRGIESNITALGYSVAGAGFFDKDGLADVVAGMPDYYTTDAQFHGGAYVATGRLEPRPVTVNPDLVPVDGYIVRAYWSASAQGRSVASGTSTATAGATSRWRGTTSPTRRTSRSAATVWSGPTTCRSAMRAPTTRTSRVFSPRRRAPTSCASATISPSSFRDSPPPPATSTATASTTCTWGRPPGSIPPAGRT